MYSTRHLSISTNSVLAHIWFLLIHNSSSSSTTCNKVYPTQGTWLRNLPLWKEKDCPVQVFDTNSTESC